MSEALSYKGSEDTIVTTNPKTGKIEELDVFTGEVVTYGDDVVVPYETHTGREFCTLVREGATFAEACAKLKVKYSQISYWRQRYPDFDEAVKLAREERAEFYHDKVVETAEETHCKDDVPVAKVKIDAYKWAAEKGDPNRFGNKNNITGAGGVTIIVDTGVDTNKIETFELDGEDYEQVERSSTRQEQELCAARTSPGGTEEGSTPGGDGPKSEGSSEGIDESKKGEVFEQKEQEGKAGENV